MAKKKTIPQKHPAETIALGTASVGALVLGLLWEWFHIDLTDMPWTTSLIMLVVGTIPGVVTYLKVRSKGR